MTTPMKSQQDSNVDTGLVPTGLTRLDAMLRGGLPKSSIVAITGLPGSGKTTLALQILAHLAARGMKGIYFSTGHESGGKTPEDHKRLTFLKDPAVLNRMAFDDLGPVFRGGSFSEALFLLANSVRDWNAEVIAIDSFRKLRDLSESRLQVWNFLADLSSQVSEKGCLTLLVGEYLLPNDLELPEFAVADAVIYLQVERAITSDVRTLRIYSYRGHPFEEGQKAFTISDNGIRF